MQKSNKCFFRFCYAISEKWSRLSRISSLKFLKDYFGFLNLINYQFLENTFFPKIFHKFLFFNSWNGQFKIKSRYLCLAWNTKSEYIVFHFLHTFYIQLGSTECGFLEVLKGFSWKASTVFIFHARIYSPSDGTEKRMSGLLKCFSSARK